MSVLDNVINTTHELFNPNDLLAFFKVNEHGVHPIVQAIKNTCSATNSAYNPDVNQFDPLCTTWVDLESKMGHQWTQAVAILICFGVVFGFYGIFLLGNLIPYLSKNLFATQMDDFTRYNNMNS